MNALMSSFHDTTNKYKKFVVEVNEENYCQGLNSSEWKTLKKGAGKGFQNSS